MAMTEKAQQQTLSLRVSDAVRSRLERARSMLAAKTGENVSTSEIAKQLLESSRDDRLEVVGMLENATDTMTEIRAKVQAGELLSKAEWTVIAYFCRIGENAFSAKTPNRISMTSTISLLEAFLAAYRIRKPSKVNRDEQYRFNLCSVGDRKDPSDIATAAERILQAMKKDGQDLARMVAPATILYELLEEEQFPSRQKLDEALMPHWPAMWRVAARGHFIEQKKPVKLRTLDTTDEDGFSSPWQPGIPSVFEGGFALSFVLGNESELSLLMTLPEQRFAMYPMSSLPMISEFRSMLERWDIRYPNSLWNGHYFFGYTGQADGGELQAWFRAQSNGISFGFTSLEWESIRELFRRAWDMPELQRVWQEGLLAYGEL
jgi:hypothetical protein